MDLDLSKVIIKWRPRARLAKIFDQSFNFGRRVWQLPDMFMANGKSANCFKPKLYCYYSVVASLRDDWMRQLFLHVVMKHVLLVCCQNTVIKWRGLSRARSGINSTCWKRRGNVKMYLIRHWVEFRVQWINEINELKTSVEQCRLGN